jgi:hypothetical protein
MVKLMLPNLNIRIFGSFIEIHYVSSIWGQLKPYLRMSNRKSRDRKRPCPEVCSAHVQPEVVRTPKGSLKGSHDLWSLPVAMVLVLLYYILYYYSKKKMREKAGHAQNILPWGLLTGNDVIKRQP